MHVPGQARDAVQQAPRSPVPPSPTLRLGWRPQRGRALPHVQNTQHADGRARLWQAGDDAASELAKPCLRAEASIRCRILPRSPGGVTPCMPRLPASAREVSGTREGGTTAPRPESESRAHACFKARRDHPRLGRELVPEAGFEPARISPHAPQTCVSASSTTPARGEQTSNPSYSSPQVLSTRSGTRSGEAAERLAAREYGELDGVTTRAAKR